MRLSNCARGVLCFGMGMVDDFCPVKGFVGMWNLAPADAKRILQQLKG